MRLQNELVSASIPMRTTFAPLVGTHIMLFPSRLSLPPNGCLPNRAGWTDGLFTPIISQKGDDGLHSRGLRLATDMFMEKPSGFRFLAKHLDLLQSKDTCTHTYIHEIQRDPDR
jgi:hypothetical protein